MSSPSPSWQSIAEAAQAHLASTLSHLTPPLPPLPSPLPLNTTSLPLTLLPPSTISITSQSPESLLSSLSTGALSSTSVVHAFLTRAALASKLTNCLTELLPTLALERAAYLDTYLSTHHRPIGPLHGLPISVKEHMPIAGLDCNAGFIAWVGQTAPATALVLKLLYRAGAVFYARTTEPQTLMHLETSSNIFGVTVNPYNRRLTCGGSSGGEGALLGLGGSCLGVGSDIGGSVRSPAANCGVFSLRPTSYRVPLGGLKATMAGEEQIVPVVGPMSTSLEGVRRWMEAVVGGMPWLYEASLVPIKWKGRGEGVRGKGRVRVGVMWDDGVVRVHPPIRRGLEWVVERLRGVGERFEVVEFPAYKHAEAWRIISSLYFPDGAKEEREAIEASGEPWRPLSEWVIKENENVRELGVAEVWGLTREREAYKDEYARYWNSVGTGLKGPGEGEVEVDAESESDGILDVLLCPVGPGCAPPLNCARYWGYTAQWNLLDYPALVFPTGLQCGPEDKIEADYQARNEQDEYNYKLYTPETYVDAPISLQLVGRRYEDEKLIDVMEMILETLKG